MNHCKKKMFLFNIYQSKSSDQLLICYIAIHTDDLKF
jgi:hypothetical protein